MLTSLIIVYSFLFALLAHKNFRLAIGLFIVSLPTYLIRFNIGPLPTTLLEVSFGILFLVWLIKYARNDIASIKYKVLSNKIFAVSCFLFLASSIAGIFVSDMWYISLGQWRAYFLEPMLVFVVLVGRTNDDGKDAINRVSTKDLIWFLILSTVSISLVAIIQKITGSFYPPALWDDNFFGRATSFFTSPNAVGLYLGPIIILALGLITRQAGAPRRDGVYQYAPTVIVVLFSVIALLFARSLGAWIAVAFGTLIFIYLIGYKKIALAIAVVAILMAVAAPPVRHQFASKQQSSSNRLVLWHYSQEFLTASPKNFVFGAGIRQFFRKIQKPHYNAKELERLIYPHNIFLNFWTEIGLVGMLAFISLLSCLSLSAYRLVLTKNKYLGAALLSALVVIFVHGLIDVPYFKNDLAILFWIIAAIIFSVQLDVTKHTSLNTY